MAMGTRTRLTIVISLFAHTMAWASDVDWASLSYTLHGDLQAVDSNGNATFPLNDPIKLRGVLINWGGDTLNTAPDFDPFMGGQWQAYVQATDFAGDPADDGDFGGSALFMGQHIGKVHGNHPAGSYMAIAWFAELDRLEHDLSTGVLLQPGDLVEVRARAPGLPFRGKTNINEAHSNDPAANFDVVLLQSKYGLPQPALLTLADVKDAGNAFIFDATRATGAEHYQGAMVRFDHVTFVNSTGWGQGAGLEIQDGAGRTLPVLLGRGTGFRNFGPPAGAFSIVGVFDQEDSVPGDGLKAGYRLWAPDYDGSAFVMARHARPDFDTDADVDGDDGIHFTTCISGPAIPQTDVNCQAADFDGDGDVDQSDYGIYQRCVSGSNQRADPGCSDVP